MIKYKDLPKIYKGLEAIAEKKLGDVAFHVDNSRNKRVVKKAIDEVEEMVKEPESLKEFNKKVKELRVEFSLKTEEGKPMLEMGRRGPIEKVDPARAEEHETAYNQLLTEYGETFKLIDKAQELYNERLEQEIDFPIFRMSYSKVEKFLASEPQIIDDIYDIIDFEKPEKQPKKKASK